MSYYNEISCFNFRADFCKQMLKYILQSYPYGECPLRFALMLYFDIIYLVIQYLFQ